MENKIKTLFILRLVVAVISGLLVVYAIPIYDEPFGGCEVIGLTTLERVCSTWQYFGLGLAIVLLFWVIKPKYVILKYWGFILVALLALLGGPEAIGSGFHLDILNNSSNLIFYWREYGLVLIFGAILGLVLLAILDRWLGSSK